MLHVLHAIYNKPFAQVVIKQVKIENWFNNNVNVNKLFMIPLV